MTNDVVLELNDVKVEVDLVIVYRRVGGGLRQTVNAIEAEAWQLAIERV